MRSIYVILIDGWPYHNDKGLRTYKTLTTATREAANLGKRGYWRAAGKRISVAEFSAINVTDVFVPEVTS